MQITNGIGWVLLMIIFIFLRKSAWKFLQRQGLVSPLYTKVLTWPNPNFQESLLPVSEQDPLHRLIELFFTDTGEKSASQCHLTKHQIPGQPDASRGTWNQGLEVSGQSYRAPSPAGEGGVGGGAVGAEPLQGGGGAAGAGGEPLQGGAGGAGGESLQEDVADSETSPALSPRLQRQQSSVLLLDQVVIVLATGASLKKYKTGNFLAMVGQGDYIVG